MMQNFTHAHQPLQVTGRPTANEKNSSVIPSGAGRLRSNRLRSRGTLCSVFAVVVTLAITQAAEPLNGREISGNFLITDIWVFRNEKWLIAERHSSRQDKASVPVRGAFQAFDRGR